ncbi:MAG: precorrin-6y C5,15-methyltransferase (decarboxylating) subunit CbiE [Hyphomicrobium sp.]
MSSPWLTIVGIGEDGLSGLSLASREALAKAEIVFGAERHLALAEAGARGRPWPVPFDVAPVLACRGQQIVVLASGDPFYFGAGGSLAAHLNPEEWRAEPSPSTFSLAAARLGWRLEDTLCFGLHAAPFERLMPVLGRGARLICLVRDGDAVGALGRFLVTRGFGATRMWRLFALGGPREQISEHLASDVALPLGAGPVAVALDIEGGHGLSRASGLADNLFIHDGQITKRPSRALVLSALAPRPRHRLWDIGAGSGSISVEWALAGGVADAIETRADRAANIRANALAFGVEYRLSVIEGAAPSAFAELAPPDAVFVGGGLNAGMFDVLWPLIPIGARLVAHSVTLETEALLTKLQNTHGGELLRMELSHSVPLGRMRSWEASRPVVQWSAVK